MGVATALAKAAQQNCHVKENLSSLALGNVGHLLCDHSGLCQLVARQRLSEIRSVVLRLEGSDVLLSICLSVHISIRPPTLHPFLFPPSNSSPSLLPFAPLINSSISPCVHPSTH